MTFNRRVYMQIYYRNSIKNYRARALLKRMKKNSKFECRLTLKDINFLLTITNCQCCERLLDYSAPKRCNETPSIDRVNPHLGYTISNSRMLCFACNRRKQDSTSADLRMIADYIDRNAQQMTIKSPST